MGRTKKIKTSPLASDFNTKDIEKILGECHDGEDYKVQMKDGSVKIVAKSEIDEK